MGKSKKCSEELKRLIDYIKENELHIKYDLALNYDGILYLVDTDLLGSNDNWSIAHTFGFDCDKEDDLGFFFLFRQVPDDDPVRIMEENGISVGRLENYADMADDLREGEDSDEEED